MRRRMFYQHSGITLHHADSCKFYPEADVIITDPVWPNCPAGLIPGSENPWELFAKWCKKVNWIKLKRIVVIMRYDSDPRFLKPIVMPFSRVVHLPYVIPGYRGRYLGGDEFAYCFGTPIPSREGQRVIPGRAPSVQAQSRSGHPCGRADEHMEFLVRWWSEPDETILDPFCGGGTTLAAAKNLGRKAIGVDVSKEYLKIAVKNLSQEVFRWQ